MVRWGGSGKLLPEGARVSAREKPAAGRRGGTMAEVLVTLSIAGLLGVATLVILPRYLVAESGDTSPRTTAAQQDVHRELIDDLAEIIGQSVGVLAIHERGATPFVEVVLWLEDGTTGTTGHADRHEVALLSHSSILQTITIFWLGGDGGPAEPPSVGPDFCDRWRADPLVSTVVLGRGVADMRVEPVGPVQMEWGEAEAWGGFQRLLLTLTWAADSADGPDEASAQVDTVMFPPGVWGAPDPTRRRP